MPNNNDWDARSVSVRLDGVASIEHQIDIHVLDLVEALHNPDILVTDVLQGLRYVVEYRIQGAKMPHLEPSLMKRLADGLLNYTAKKQGNLLAQRPTDDANLCFGLVAAFGAEVEEFRTALASYSPNDLCHYLKIHRRCQFKSTQEQRDTCALLLGHLTKIPRFSDWHELVKEEEWDDVEGLIKEYPHMFTSDPMKAVAHVFPPPGMYLL